ncbi:hypothetical protein N7457_004111 [Penicillium paradoxum]|uniref:uncharacterized protein n=1 Tax=Penicillium paradoxum TaxID=176176 RepID=UPI002546E356|nr:uncharacterized protein N7457_004111 [Penicillium paradoxum]KAJ5782337.1 hypothetical protein N7457_004111 [Penicillium paradoxum]
MQSIKARGCEDGQAFALTRVCQPDREIKRKGPFSTLANCFKRVDPVESTKLSLWLETQGKHITSSTMTSLELELTSVRQ